MRGEPAPSGRSHCSHMGQGTDGHRHGQTAIGTNGADSQRVSCKGGGYGKVKEELSSVDGVILAGRRIVIPAVLRAAVIQTLGLAHQGEAAM